VLTTQLRRGDPRALLNRNTQGVRQSSKCAARADDRGPAAKRDRPGGLPGVVDDDHGRFPRGQRVLHGNPAGDPAIYRPSATVTSGALEFVHLAYDFHRHQPRRGALESSPWRKPWETRTTWSPGAKEPFRASDRSPGTKRFLTPLRGWHLSGPLPQGLRPGLLSSAPDGAWDRAGARLTRRDELGVEAETRPENVQTQAPR
jgi:hypothetical protein